MGLRVSGKGRITLGAFSLLIVHGELAIRGEEVGIVVVDVCVVGDDVVFFDEIFDGWVGNGVRETGELEWYDDGLRGMWGGFQNRGCNDCVVLGEGIWRRIVEAFIGVGWAHLLDTYD